MKTRLLIPAGAAALVLAFLAGLACLGRLPPAWQRVFLPRRGLSAAPPEVRSAAPHSAPDEVRVRGAAPSAGAQARPSAFPAAVRARQEVLERLKKQKILEMLQDYRPFLEKLPPEQADRLRRQLLDSKEAYLQGIIDRQAAGASAAEIAQFDADSSRLLLNSVREILGEDGYSSYRDFTEVLPYVKEGEQIGNRLYAENVPASSEQINALVQAMLAAPKAPSMDRVAEGTISLEAYGQALADSSQEFVAGAASILSPDQVRILQAYENENRQKYLRAASQLLRRNPQ